jgi:enoyl-CoA hydratase
MAQGAKIGLPEVGLGIIPGYGGTQRLPRIVGRGRAFEVILSGNPIDAETAERWGLVNGTAPAVELTAKVRAFAATLLTRGPLALAMAIESVLRGSDLPMAEGMRVECDLFGLVSSTADMKEGLTAFLEKRKPGYRGA